MEMVLDLKGFEGRRLIARSASALSGPRLIVDGMPAKAHKGKYTIKNNYGQDIEFRWKPDLLMLDPALIIAGDTIHFHNKRLAWYEYVWVALPLTLLLIGGAIGGALGGAATCINASIYRTQPHVWMRYLATGTVTLCAALLWLGVAMLIYGASAPPPPQAS